MPNRHTAFWGKTTVRLFFWTWVAGVFWLVLNAIDVFPFGMVICPFRRFTGLPCPTCGVTTALLFMIDGDFWQAIYINPMSLLIGFFLLAFPLWVGFDWIAQQNTIERTYLFWERLLVKHKPILVLMFLVGILNWVWVLFHYLTSGEAFPLTTFPDEPMTTV